MCVLWHYVLLNACTVFHWDTGDTCGALSYDRVGVFINHVFFFFSFSAAGSNTNEAMSLDVAEPAVDALRNGDSPVSPSEQVPAPGTVAKLTHDYERR